MRATSADIYRAPVYEALYPHLEEFAPRDGSHALAEISGNTLNTVFGYHPRRITRLEPPAFDAQDLRTYPKEGRRFDLVYADFVLEHIPNPWTAVQHLRSLLIPGGHLVLTTAFLFPIHGSRQDDDGQDFFRFSPAGLRALLSGAGWEDVHAYGWGSEAAASAVLRWQANREDSALGIALVEAGNDLKFPVLTFAWGRRPG